jgi:hypothetical protein
MLHRSNMMVNKELYMKVELNIRPAAEIPASEALRPVEVNEVTGPMPVSRRVEGETLPSRLSLLARRQARLARRAVR